MLLALNSKQHAWQQLLYRWLECFSLNRAVVLLSERKAFADGDDGSRAHVSVFICMGVCVGSMQDDAD